MTEKRSITISEDARERLARVGVSDEFVEVIEKQAQKQYDRRFIVSERTVEIEVGHVNVWGEWP